MALPKFDQTQVGDIGDVVSWQQIAETLVALDAKPAVGEPLDEATNALAELLGNMAFERTEIVPWSRLNDLQRAALRRFHERELTTPLAL